MASYLSISAARTTLPTKMQAAIDAELTKAQKAFGAQVEVLPEGWKWSYRIRTDKTADATEVAIEAFVEKVVVFKD